MKIPEGYILEDRVGDVELLVKDGTHFLMVKHIKKHEDCFTATFIAKWIGTI